MFPLRHIHRRNLRHGQILVMFAMLLPVLAMVVGLVIEAGLIMAARVELQGISDGAARLVALSESQEMAASDPEFVTQLESYLAETQTLCTDVTYKIHQPPIHGPFAGEPGYTEVEILGELPTAFRGLLGTEESVTVSAATVVSAIPVSTGARIVALDRTARPGLMISGVGDVVVQGGVIVNSRAGGSDRHGDWVEDGVPGVAAQINGGARLFADDVQVSGGVNDATSFFPLNPDEAAPLRTFVPPIADPFADVPKPTTQNGVTPLDRGYAKVTAMAADVRNGNLVLSDGTVELYPGIYTSIQIQGGRVVFRPGIYVLTGSGLASLLITGGDVSSSGGVMFYRTAPGYDPETGAVADLSTAEMWTEAGIVINQAARLKPLGDSTSPFDNMLIFQDRALKQSIRLQGQSDLGGTGGTIYAPSASLEIAGQGTLNGQIVVGRFVKSGSGNLTIQSPAEPPAIARRIMQVE
jgi:hypothetical protein